MYSEARRRPRVDFRAKLSRDTGANISAATCEELLGLLFGRDGSERTSFQDSPPPDVCIQRLRLQCDEPVSSFASKSILRHCTLGRRQPVQFLGVSEAPRRHHWRMTPVAPASELSSTAASSRNLVLCV
jgi:hypothetical protein